MVTLSNNPNVIKNIQDSYSSLSKGLRIIAEYMINHYDKAAFMTAASLGKILNISESTVVRFANALGYTGYKELQKELQELIRNKLTTVQRINLSGEFNSNGSTYSKVIEKDIENMKKTLTELDPNSFSQAIEKTIKAKQIYIMGLRSSSFLSGYLSFYLNFIFDNIRTIAPGANDIFEQIAKASKDDVIICITYPRYSKRTLEALEYAKAKGCQILITGHTHMPKIEAVDNVTHINPGSIAYPRGNYPKTFVEITFSSIQDVTIALKEVEEDVSN